MYGPQNHFCFKVYEKRGQKTNIHIHIHVHTYTQKHAYVYNSITYTTTIDNLHTVYVLHVSQRLLCKAYVSYTNCKPSVQIKAAVTQVKIYNEVAATVAPS